MMLHITAANTIYPVNEDEILERRRHQNDAIIACEQLMQELLYCEDVIPIKASKFMPYIERIEFEIKLLKGWRKSNTKIKELINSRKEKKEGGDQESK
ncbi:hypothetical protein FACS1894137_17470 [Spirochaetia bacterium]|nr:hypothetical protein FACS1894137_17470 [Spirochaetia bacterium]